MYAAASEVTFFCIVPSSSGPIADTGVAAPVFVPGAMTATSAEIMIKKPAEAARAPAGAT